MIKMFKKEKKDPDEELLSALKNSGITITEQEIQKARENDVQTLYNIGSTYLKINSKTAFKWLHKAASLNHSAAQLQVADMYWEGRSVPKSYDKAMKWYRKASDNGIVDADYKIGCLHQSGFGVLVDYKRSMKWYMKAAEKGYPNAQNEIGNFYHNGLGVIKNIDTAIKWYTKASDQEYAMAQNNLGVVYQYQNDIQDLQEAVYWYQKAANNGYRSAKDKVRALNRQGYYAKLDQNEQQLGSIDEYNNNHIDKINNQNMENIINDLQLRIVAMEKENKISNEENKISNDVLQNKINALQQENKKKDQEIKQKDEEIKLLQATLATYEWDAHRDLNYDSECDGNDRNGHTHGTLDNAADPNYNSSDNEDPRNDICYD